MHTNMHKKKLMNKTKGNEQVDEYGYELKQKCSGFY